MTKVTVYVPSRNYGRFLRQALLSVVSQTFTDWELIIFDEASDDETESIAREFEARLPPIAFALFTTLDLWACGHAPTKPWSSREANTLSV